jgi:hypothetical protein
MVSDRYRVVVHETGMATYAVRARMLCVAQHETDKWSRSRRRDS